MFIAFTSNVFAILGLRRLYFLLAGSVEMFRYLHYGLAAVLAFVGVKMIAEYLDGGRAAHVICPSGLRSVVIAVLLVVSIVVSVVGRLDREKRRDEGGERKAESGEK